MLPSSHRLVQCSQRVGAVICSFRENTIFWKRMNRFCVKTSMRKTPQKASFFGVWIKHDKLSCPWRTATAVWRMNVYILWVSRKRAIYRRCGICQQQTLRLESSRENLVRRSWRVSYQPPKQHVHAEAPTRRTAPRGPLVSPYAVNAKHDCPRNRSSQRSLKPLRRSHGVTCNGCSNYANWANYNHAYVHVLMQKPIITVAVAIAATYYSWTIYANLFQIGN